MRTTGIEGRRDGKKRRTTKPDPAAARHPDLVERVFRARGLMADAGSAGSCLTWAA
jgi:hypothetical protein